MFAFNQVNISMAGGTPPNLIDIEQLRRHRLLAPAASKLGWARRHLAALEHNITETFTFPANHAVIRANLDAQSGEHLFCVSELPVLDQFAEDFAHVVADVAKNLHPALDQLAWQLACDFSTTGFPKDPKGVYFPITDSPDLWAEQGRARGQISKPHWDFIERFQPYHGVNGRADSWHGDYVHQLAFLRDLANDDKHRIGRPIFMLPSQLDLTYLQIARIPVAQAKAIGITRPGTFMVVTRMDHPVYPAPTESIDPNIETNDWQVTGIGKPLELDLEVMRARLVPPVEPEINPAGFARPLVAFGDGRAAVATLQRVESFVHLVLSEFARQFP